MEYSRVQSPGAASVAVVAQASARSPASCCTRTRTASARTRRASPASAWRSSASATRHSTSPSSSPASVASRCASPLRLCYASAIRSPPSSLITRWLLCCFRSLTSMALAHSSQSVVRTAITSCRFTSWRALPTGCCRGSSLADGHSTWPPHASSRSYVRPTYCTPLQLLVIVKLLQ